jgi:sulfite reductase alpha subunit-like flavoprotein
MANYGAPSRRCSCLVNHASPLSYQPGDVAVIHPRAAQEDVFAFLNLAGWQDIADELLQIYPSGEFLLIRSRAHKLDLFRYQLHGYQKSAPSATNNAEDLDILLGY